MLANIQPVQVTEIQTLTKLLLEELHQARCWQRQTLAEAAAEIQKRLKQLENINPTATEAQQKAFVTAAIEPPRLENFVSALQAGWKDMMQELLPYPYRKLGIAMLEEWKKTL